MSHAIEVLSLQTDILGNKTYSTLMRDHFARSRQCHVESLWFHEQRGLRGRALHKLLAWKLPGLTRLNIDLRRARAEWVYGQVGKWLAQRKLSEKHYDLLHFHTQVHAFGSQALMRKIPTIVSTDLTAYQVARENPRFSWTYEPNIRMEKRIFDAARHLVVFSQWTKDSIIHEHNIPAEKVSVIAPGVPIDRFRIPSSAEKPAVPRLLFVGGDFVRKGGEDLLAVFLERFTDQAELHIMTGHPIKATHPKLFVYSDVEAYSEKWHQLFRSASYFVMPTYAEAFGIVFQEALGYGLPVIATGINAIPDIVEDGVCGFLIEPGDREALAQRIAILLNDSAMATRMSFAARDRAQQRFDSRQNFGKLENLFIKLAAERRNVTT